MNYKTVFTYQVLCDLWMNKRIWVKRLNTVIAITKPSLTRLCGQSDRLNNKMAIPTANRPSHERLNNANIIISSKNYAISTVLWVLSHLAQWHNVLAFRTSGTLWDLWEAQTLLGWPSGMLAHSWHAGTLAHMLAQ